jgi:ABC-type nitrate/sulfonate/bicarbonate transport system permease component
VIFLFWFLATSGAPEQRWISPTLLPSPSETFGSFHALWFDGALTLNLVASLRRVLEGFFLATIIGVPLGVIGGCFPRVNAFLAPISVFGRNVPISTLAPLTVVWFGLGEKQMYMFIFVACVMFIVYDATRAVVSVHERYLQTAFTLGAKPLQVVRKVIVPLALPEVFGSLRLLFGLAFGYIILAELYGAESGLGFLITIAQRRGMIGWVYLILFVITGVAYLLDRLFLMLQRALFPWREE